MDKISGILPSSARVASVDLKESGTVRPGTPGFGRSEGASALRDAKIGQTASRASEINKEKLDWKAKDMKNAATVRDLSDRFFKGNDKPATDNGVEAVIEREMNTEPLTAARPSMAAGFDRSALDEVTSSMGDAQPEGLHARGSFLDVRA